MLEERYQLHAGHHVGSNFQVTCRCACGEAALLSHQTAGNAEAAGLATELPPPLFSPGQCGLNTAAVQNFKVLSPRGSAAIPAAAAARDGRQGSDPARLSSFPIPSRSCTSSCFSFTGFGTINGRMQRPRAHGQAGGRATKPSALACGEGCQNPDRPCPACAHPLCRALETCPGSHLS